MAREKPKGDVSSLYRLAGIGFELAAAVTGCTLIGWYYDRHMGTTYGVITGATLGIVGGLYNFIRQSLKTVKDDQERRHQRERDGDGSG